MTTSPTLQTEPASLADAAPIALTTPASLPAVHRLRVARVLTPTPRTLSASELEPLIPLFHRWIQQRVLPWTLIDITDYRHIEAGPGLLLVGHQGDVVVGHDETGRAIVGYLQKRSEVDGFEAHLDLALDRLSLVVDRLREESELRGLGRDSAAWSLRVYDRLATRDLAPDPLARRLTERLEGRLGVSQLHRETDALDPRRALGLTWTPAK